jgi:hypothetical protein
MNHKTEVNDDDSEHYRELSLTTLAGVESSTPNEDRVYRSMTLVDNSGSSVSSHKLDQPYEGVIAKKSSPASSSSQKSLAQIAAKKLVASEYPDILMSTHFHTNIPLEIIYAQIEKLLKESNGVSYEFAESLSQWTVVYLNGSVHSKFQITVYDGKLHDFVVEGNRLMGDSFSFRSVYAQIKHALSNSVQSNEEHDSFCTAFPLPVPSCSIDEAESNIGVDCILRMARECTVEAHCAAAKVLCDLSLDDCFQQTLVEKGGLGVLKELVQNSACEWSRQHAIIAVSNLSDARLFQKDIIKEGYLPVLLSLAVDGPYHTAELRRCAVHILANICHDHTSEVVAAIGHKDVCCCMNLIDSLADDKLKVHAARAKESLSGVVFAS